MLKVSIVVGNPKPRSRTRRIGELFVRELLPGAAHETETVDLCDHVGEIFKWPSETMAGLNERVARAHLIVVCSPTYKATYTGLLKAFLDRYPADGLKGTIAVPIMTGADLRHSMAPDTSVVPLLLELGAVIPGRGAYFPMSSFDIIEELVRAEAARVRQSLDLLAVVAGELRATHAARAGAPPPRPPASARRSS